MPNRRSRHPWIAALLCGLCALASACGCEEKKPDPNVQLASALERAERAEAERRRRTDAGRPRPRAVASALAELRNTELELVPLSLPAQVLALGRGRLAQLANDEVIVRRLPDLEVVVRAAATGNPSVLELLDGSLLALGRDRVLHLAPNRTKWREYARVPLLPGRYVYPDLQYAGRFWILLPFSGTLFRHDLDADAGGVAFGASFDLPAYDGRAFSVLKDASLLYTTAKRWQRSFSARRHVPLSGVTPDGVLRVLPAKRLDHVWLLTQGGALILTQLGATLKEVRRVEIGAVPFDAASNDDGLAVLQLEQAPPRPRRWRLAVYAHDGERRFSVDLADDSAPGATDDWVSEVTRNKNVAVSRHEPWVAVGGASSVRVWNMQDGTLARAL